MMICAFFFAAVTFANAQQGGGQGGPRRMQMSPEERVKQLDEKVKLTDDQKTKATTVYTEQAEAMKKFREENQGGDRAAMMEAMTKMNTDTDTKISAFLTADQKTAYKTWQDEVKAAREKMMKERQQGGGQ